MTDSGGALRGCRQFPAVRSAGLSVSSPVPNDDILNRLSKRYGGDLAAGELEAVLEE